MKFLHPKKTRKFAKKDAESGQEQGHDRVVSLMGPRPEFDTEKFPQQGFLADDLQKEPMLKEYETILAEDLPGVRRTASRPALS